MRNIAQGSSNISISFSFVLHIPVVKEAKQESKNCGTGSNDRNPSLASQIGEVHKPVTRTKGLVLIGTVIREESFTRTVTALESRFELVRNIQLLSLNVGEQELLDTSCNQNRHGHGKVMEVVADTITAEKARVLEATESKDQSRRSETKNGTEQRNFHVVVAFDEVPIVVLEVFVGFVVGIKVSQNTNIGKWITNRIKHKDGHNQKGEDLIRETCGQTNDASQIEEGGRDAVEQQPARDPSVEGEVRNFNVLGNSDDCLCEGNHWTSRPNNTLTSCARSRKKKVS